METMPFKRCRNRRMSTLFGLLFWCLLFECTIGISAIKNLRDQTINGAEVTNARYAPAKIHSLFSRQRRRLQTDSNDQSNSLDGNDVQYQEYQGVFGRPGVDFPVLSSIPVTKFNCRDVQNSHNGYYADLETNCQVFHVCDGGRKVSFLCPNGTIFRQSHLICDWWFRVECERSPELFEQSIKHYESDQAGFKQRVAVISNAMRNALSKGGTDSMLLESPVTVSNKLNEQFNSESELPRSHQRRPINRPPSQNINQYPVTTKQSSFDQNQPSLANSQTYNQNQKSFTNVGLTHNQNQPFLSSQPLSQNLELPFNGNPSFINSIDSTKESYTGQTDHMAPQLRTKFAVDLSIDKPVLARTQFNTLSFSSPTATSNSSSSPPQLYNNESFRATSTSAISFNDAQNLGLVSKARPFSQPTDFAFNEISSTKDTLDDYMYSPTPPPPLGTLTVSPPSRFSHNSLFTSQQPVSPQYIVSLQKPTPSQQPALPQYTNKSYSTTYSQNRSQIGGSQEQLSSTRPAGQSVQTVTPTTFTRSKFKPNTFEPVAQTQSTNGISGQSVLPMNDINEHQVLAETAAFAGQGRYQDFLYNTQNYIQQTGAKAKGFSSTLAPQVLTTLNPNVVVSDAHLYKTTSYEQNSVNDLSENLDAVIDLLNTVPSGQPSRDTGVTKPAVSQYLLNVTLANSDFNAKGTEPTVDQTITSLLTNQTQEAYKQLFPQLVEEILSSAGVNDLQSEHSRGLLQSSSPKPQPATQTSALDVRELAQIFSRALSAYLEDPEQFRRILSEVRPTEPPPSSNSLKNESEDEVLAFSEDSGRSTTRPPADDSLTTSRQIRDPETFAEEINNFMIAEPSQVDTYSSSKPTIAVSFAVSPMIDYTNSENTTDVHPTTVKNTATSSPDQTSTSLQPTIPTFPLTRDSSYDNNDIGLVPPALPSTQQDNWISREYTNEPIEQSKHKQENSYSKAFPSITSPSPPKTTFYPEEQSASAVSAKSKNTLYDEGIAIIKPVPDNHQSISDDQLLITADTQSFVSKDNLLAFNDNVRPILKTPAYSQFGIRSKTSLTPTASQSFPSDNSRAYFIQTTPQTAPQNEPASTNLPAYATDALLSSVSAINDGTNYSTSSLPSLPPLFNESAVHAMVNMMEEAQVNPSLRSKLVLLLVNDRIVPHHKSVRDLKSKLLKALVVPPKSTSRSVNGTQPELQQQPAESRQYFQYQATSSKQPEWTIVVTEPTPNQTNPVQIQHQSPSPIRQLQQPQSQLEFQKVQQQLQQQQQDSFISRDGRDTTSPVPVTSENGKGDCPNSVLSEADARAVDLLKTLYSIAANNWRQ